MIGGTVLEIVRLMDKTWVRCQDNDNKDTCAIYLVEHPDHCVMPGDQIWWLDRTAFWTTPDGTFIFEPLQKIGNSGDIPKPTETKVAQAIKQMNDVEALMAKVEFV